MSEDILVESDSQDNEEDFDGFEFIVELVDDDEEDQGEEGTEEEEILSISNAASSDDKEKEQGQREFFKYVDGFLTKSKHEKEEEEKKRQQELVERKGLFKCSICGKFFLYRSKIHHHLVHDHNVDKSNRLNCWVIDEAEDKSDRPMIPCHICGKTYQMKDSLARHIKIKHTDYKKIKCPMCPTEFTQKSDVERHIRRKHSEYIDRPDMGEDYEEMIRASKNLMLPTNPPPGATIVKQELRNLPYEGIDTIQSYTRKTRVDAMVEDAMNGKDVMLGGVVANEQQQQAPHTEINAPTSSKVNNLVSDFDKAAMHPVGSEFDRIVIKAEKEDDDYHEIPKSDVEHVAVKAEPVEIEPTVVKKPSSSKSLLQTRPSAREVPEYVDANDFSQDVKNEPSESSEDASPTPVRLLGSGRKSLKQPANPQFLGGKTLKQPANPQFLAALSYANVRKRTQEMVKKGEVLLKEEIRCSICSQMFNSRAQFVNHLVRKHGIDEVQANSKMEDWMDQRLSHECKSCSFTCINKEELKRHIEVG